MLRPKKSLGQHFLRDDNVVRKIVAAVAPGPDDVILEIGPGTGALTRPLAGLCRLIAVDVDGRAIELLRPALSGTTLIHADVRDLDLHDVHPGGRTRIVGNLPYNITSDILFWLFDQRRLVADATLMMQAEVAERLTAAPRTKAYGILSVAAQWYAEPRRLFKVSRSSFAPVPDVDSAVVRLTLRDAPEGDPDRAFRTLIRGLFGKRRKTIRNGLRFMGMTDDDVQAAGSVATQRPEELTPEGLFRLAQTIGPERILTTAAAERLAPRP